MWNRSTISKKYKWKRERFAGQKGKRQRRQIPEIQFIIVRTPA